jgi:hypothetical protein
MNKDQKDTVAEDYDDAPWRTSRHPIGRVLLAIGCLTTMRVTAVLCALVQFGIGLSRDELFVGGIVSVASIPVLIYFWSESITWRRNGYLKTLVVSLLCWLTQVLISAYILFIVIHP